jgi:hypothetical protein
MDPDRIVGPCLKLGRLVFHLPGAREQSFGQLVATRRGTPEADWTSAVAVGIPNHEASLTVLQVEVAAAQRARSSHAYGPYATFGADFHYRFGVRFPH